MSEQKKTREEVLQEIDGLQRELETIDEEDGESSLTRRVVLGSAWVAPVIVVATLPADAQSPPSTTQTPTYSPTHSPTWVTTQSPTHSPTWGITQTPTASPTQTPTMSP